MKIPVGIPIFVAAAGVDPKFARLVHRYLLSAVVWLLLGTLAGLLDAFRFNHPDFLEVAWLSFGRVRPIHTGMVLWGWASLALIGISLYVVPRSCRTNLHSVRAARVALWLWNAAIALGSVALAAGQNNGNQEYREYPIFLRLGAVPLPVVPLLAAAALLLVWTIYKTIAARTVRQIYISNWFMLGAPLFATVLVVVGWMPGFNRGAGQPIIQGWYMHNAVGMWFTPLAVGATYYTLPKLLNKPIYSYGLGVLGFWTHLVFYTLIGTHHYIFSPLPAWLQTASIIFSTAMMVPVWASTGNFLLTMRGERSAMRTSYSLPFMLAGAVGYGLASAQGTAESFKAANEVWHFTDYTVGHAHLAMVGFVSFLIWGSVYGLLPRVTGREPRVELVGVHFWMSLVGLVMMGVSLCVGGHARGLSWIAGEPFMESVDKMVPYWVWRSVGGTFMGLGHLVFAYNVWSMRPGAFVDLMRDGGGTGDAR
ncbi:MAG: cbb3-type cytochrome c oxidase subunit I [Planctomycetes bacterium]|nr:cbb3-type cytochrome c oxidase subunit I [Planctomycetota bacterium]